MDPMTSTLENSISKHLYERANRVMPGGVSSPVRAYRSVGGEPFFIASGSGSNVTTEDGLDFLDFVCSWGPLILGHAHPTVVEAIQDAAARGTSFGAPCLAETELAEMICELSPAVEKVRFVNSGTEATLSALRLARAVTGRDVMVKFDGCYHGHGDSFLVKAGSGLATFGESSSIGVPASTSTQTAVLPLDDEEALRAYFAEHGSDTAAVFVEGIPANCGLLPQSDSWWRTLRDVTSAAGTMLVVDEVITGFRVGAGGFCEQAGIDADIVTYGKVIGGGLPVGAYGASAELMNKVSPEGGVYQAGTLSGNPLGMAAGLATLNVLKDEDGWSKLEALGASWEERIQPLLKRETEAGHPVAMTRAGSIFWLCFGTDTPPGSFGEIPQTQENTDRFGRFFHELLDRQVMIAPSAFEVGFLNLSLSESDLDRAAAAFDAALESSR